MPTDRTPQVQETSSLWRCPGCGTNYTADVGECGQRQPFDCRERVVPVPQNTPSDYIAAMRLAVEASADAEAARAVIVEILSMAPDTDGARTAPVSILVEAIKAAGLGFEVTSG